MPLDPTLKLRPGLPSDVSAMAEIFLDAFSGNMVGRAFFPRSSPSARKFWTDALTSEIRDPHAHFLVVTDPSDEPVAFAKWVAPLGPDAPAPPPLPAESEWPADGNPALAAVFFRRLADAHQAAMGTTPHWYLEVLATRGADQGRGAGGLLVAWGAARADEERAPCYLDATPEGRPLYRRIGFADVETWPFFGGEYRHSIMVREARGAGERGGGSSARPAG